MKRFKLQRTICVLILTSCLLGVSGAFANVALGDDEKPQNVAELLASPLFEVADGASTQDVLTAARRLRTMLDDVNSAPRYRLNDLDQQARDKEIEKINIEQEENRAAFYEKFDPIFAPKLVAIFNDDKLAASGDSAINEALFLYLDCLDRAGKLDDAAPLRERELKRARKIQESNDKRALNLAGFRLSMLDAVCFNVEKLVKYEGETDDAEKKVATTFDSTLTRRLTNESKKELVETGNKVAQEFKRDPLLIFIGDRCYSALLRNDCDVEAAELRKTLLDAFDRDEYERFAKLLFGENASSLKTLALFKEYKFDESLFDIPENETYELYVERRKVLADAAALNQSGTFSSLPISKRRLNELNAKAAISLCKISFQLRKMNRETSVEPLEDFNRVQNAVLDVKTVAFFQKTFDDEAAREKPNAHYLDAIRAAILSFELDAALREGDVAKIVDARDRFLESADSNFFARNRFLRDAQSYARTNREFANQLLDAYLDKAKDSRAGLAVYAERVEELKKTFDKINLRGRF